jgi:hypothetical protein
VVQQEFIVSLKATWFRDKLKKKAKQGFQGFPVATIAYYGPDDKRASKVAVGVTLQEGSEPVAFERWYNETADIRSDAEVNEGIVQLLKHHGVKSVVSPDVILGCPHEEGIDYPDGETCPTCAFWANRDRFTGKILP